MIILLRLLNLRQLEIKRIKAALIGFLAFLTVIFWGALPGQAHVADLSLANIVIHPTTTQVDLTIPTSLVAFADGDRNQQLSSQEIRTHQRELKNFFKDRLRLSDGEGKLGRIDSIEAAGKPLLPGGFFSSNTHSNVSLKYTWAKAISKLKIEYNLFDNLPNGHCLAIVLKNGELENYIFTPSNRTLWVELQKGSKKWLTGGGLAAIAVAFSWGAVHALSPGHGKTLVGAYLVGSRANAQHALFLGLTTTVTHTLGVFVLGTVAWLASRYFLPAQLSPWLSLLSGLIVVTIGMSLLIKRLCPKSRAAEHSHLHSHPHHHHEHEHEHEHSHHHEHSHLPPDDIPITWRSLLALGVAGGLVPCPAALVLLLATIALGQIGFGLLLVSVFSLGLAAALTGLGLLLVSTKRVFDRLPSSLKAVKLLSTASALLILLIGAGLTYQAIVQIQSPF